MQSAQQCEGRGSWPTTGHLRSGADASTGGGEELLASQFAEIESIVHRVAARRRLDADARQELHSLVMLKLVQDNYAVLTRFQGRSSWTTYLTLVVQRCLLDQRNKAWGKWRPSARARRLGPTAVRLDRRIHRDGIEPRQAVRELLASGSHRDASEVHRIAAQLPHRPKRRWVTVESCLGALADPRPDGEKEIAGRRASSRLQAALSSALQALTPRDRSLLELRFSQGWTVRRIAQNQHRAERPLYRRFGKILKSVRRRLEGSGLEWPEVAAALDGYGIEVHWESSSPEDEIQD